MTRLPILLLLLLLSGCGQVDNYAIQNALDGCAQHGGLNNIYRYIGENHAICNDGAILLSVSKRPKAVQQ